MSDTEVDFDTLTALLDDSDNEVQQEDEKINQDKKNIEKTENNDEMECDLDELTSFLEQSDSDEDEVEIESTAGVRGASPKEENNHDSEPVEQPTDIMTTEMESTSATVGTEGNGDVHNASNGISEIEAKMKKMQEEMLALQAELLKQKQLNTQLQTSQNSSPMDKVSDTPVQRKVSQKVKSETSPKGLKSSDACSRQKKAALSGSIGTTKKKSKDTAVLSNEDRYPFFGEVISESASQSQDKKNKLSEKTSSKNAQSNENKKLPGRGEKPKTESEACSTEQSLFGDFQDSDSDWEELDGEEKSKLSKPGQEIKSLMKKGQEGRVSHASLDDVQALRNKAHKAKSWKERPFMGQKQIDPPPKAESKENELPSVTDPFSNIRIVNPKVSSLDMKMKMQDRKLIKVSHIACKSSADLQGNWVTIGVVVYKSEPRTSASGKTYCIWKLSDLQNCDQTITFFLFGEVYKQHWKNEVSTVAGILNPSPMDKAEKASKDLAFTVNHPNQILIMGHSKDLGKCAGTNRAGNSCTNIINKQQGEFCTYHVQAAYKKSSSKRTELQGGSAVTPKNHAYKKNKNQQGFFFYGGETFTNMRPQAANTSNVVTVKKLQAQQAAMGKGKITTMSLHNIEAGDDKRLKQLQAKDNTLMELLSTPTVGSMNVVKHLMKKENTETATEDKKKPSVQSVSAKDLLKQHKELMRQKMNKTNSGSTPPLDPMKVAPRLGKGSSGGLISLDSPRVPKLSALKAEEAKQRAIQKIQQKGGIDREDPNAVKKKSSPEAKDRISKRLIEDVDNTDCVKEPPKKKSKLLGNIDTNSEEFKALMKARSKHTGALAEAEQEMEERYFMEQEKKEKYEEKMASIMEMKCTVFSCKICKYTAFKPSDRCKQENHPLTKTQATKRFFKCKKCSRRTVSIHRLPKDPCRDCGENNFERTSMLQERKGPKLAHEELSIRGDEAKFLHSMNQKVYLNI